MNALLGQEAKANCSLFRLIRDKGADDGSRKDGGDFASTGAGAHRRACLTGRVTSVPVSGSR